ncbi:MAG: SURF1 family protein [Pseudomonadales bacterium]|nr:SURF1 family protein [Pseudomonadales bacterium]
MNVAIILFTLSAVSLCIALSVWQWQRAQAADQRFELMSKNSLEVMDELPAYPEQYQSVKISGSVENVYFLDNRSNDHRAGREVLVEVLIEGSADIKDASSGARYDRALVNIGWQPRNEGLVPTYTIPEMISVQGTLKIPSAGFMLQDPQLDPNWPRLMQSIDLPLLSRVQSTLYYPAVIYSAEPVLGWPIATLAVENKYMMHMGYCIQWLLLAAVFVIFFIKVSVTRNQHDNQQTMAV